MKTIIFGAYRRDFISTRPRLYYWFLYLDFAFETVANYQTPYHLYGFHLQNALSSWVIAPVDAFKQGLQAWKPNAIRQPSWKTLFSTHVKSSSNNRLIY